MDSTPQSTANIRPARPGDRDAILALVPRLAATGTPPGRDRARIEAADLASVGEALASEDGSCAVLVAEDAGAIVGFVHVRRVRDYYTQTEIAHISDVVVAPEAGGQGLGARLVGAAEDWARAQGHALIQLYVLPGNAPARRVYERAGYAVEWLKYLKPLD